MVVGRKIRNIASGFLAACGGLVAAGGFLLTSLWIDRGAAAPDPARGLTYLLKGVSSIAFVSRAQSQAVPAMVFAGVGLFFLAAFLTPKTNVRRQTSFGGIRWNWDRDDPEKVTLWGALLGAAAAAGVVWAVWMLAR